VKKVIKTPGQVAFESLCEETGSRTSWAENTSQDGWEKFAQKYNIPPLEQDVPETNGELLAKVRGVVWALLDEATRLALEYQATELLQAAKKRDGEPLEVTAVDLDRWDTEITATYSRCKYAARGEYTAKLAAKINAHRGVRPEKPTRR